MVGKDGGRNIAILSGTEKVWLNGQRLERGENYDYTIDYSSSEIYFTPKRLIDFDTAYLLNINILISIIKRI